MTLQQMEYIVAVDKYRHFARAAESCGVTQSTLSSLIQKLETELDITIFDRSSHPIKPTTLGVEVINRAKILLFNASQIEELVSSHKGESVGKVRMGVAPTIAPYTLPKMFKTLSEEHPDIDLYVEEARVTTIIEKLERAELDIALLATPLNNSELLEIPITESDLLPMSPNKRICTKRRSLRPQNYPSRVYGCCARGIVPTRGCSHFANREPTGMPYMRRGALRPWLRL